MGNIYAFVDYGVYRDYDFMFIQINEQDKEKFREFCEDSRGFGWAEEITIKGWMKDVILEEENVLDVMTIEQYQGRIKCELEHMGDSHYLKGKRGNFVKLVEYEFMPTDVLI